MTAAADLFDVRSLALVFRPGASLPRHAHSWGQLVFATSGVMRVETPSSSWLAPPTKAIWVPAGLVHHIQMQGAVALRTLYIADDRARDLPKTPQAIAVSPLLRELILHILALGMLTPARPDQDRLAGLLIDLVRAARREDLGLPMPDDPRARRLAERVLERPQDRRPLQVWARESGASLRTLQRLFSKETGLTLEAWRRKARLAHGLADLIGGSAVSTAAADCGYESVGAFIGAFSRQFGATPGRYLQS